MYGAEPEDVFYYLTLYNENYAMPPMPEGVEDGIVRGPLPLPRRRRRRGSTARRSSRSGTAMLAALEAQQMLADEHDVAADVWSATSYKLLREDALSVERWNRLHPTERAARRRTSTELLGDAEGPIVAVTDFMKAVPDQIAPVRARSRSSRSAPTATGSPTPAPRCAATSRSTRRTSWSRCSTALARDRRRQGRGRRRGDPPLRPRPRHDPTRALT